MYADKTQSKYLHSYSEIAKGDWLAKVLECE